MNDSPTPAPDVFVGLDWADQKHDVCWLTADGRTGSFELPHTTADLDRLPARLQELAGGGTIRLAFEKSRGPLLYALMHRPELQLYLIDPKQSSQYRASFSSAGAKCDATDAALLARLLRERQAELKPLVLDDEPTRLLAELARARRQLVDQRTSIIQRLTALLKRYFPLLLELGPVDGPLVQEVLRRTPDPREFRRLHPRTLAAVLRHGKTRNDEQLQAEVQRIRAAPLLTQDGPVIAAHAPQAAAAAEQLRVLARHIEDLERQLDAAYAQHPDAALLQDVPGAGRALGPRLLAAFGSDRDRFANAEELASFSGVAPVTRQSGKLKVVVRRRAAPQFLKQTFHEFADAARKWCPWSRAFYQWLRSQGMAHHAVLRKLARAWIRILFQVWKSRTPYDPDRYLQQLKAKNHPALKFLPPTTATP